MQSIPWIVLIVSILITTIIGVSFFDSQLKIQQAKFETDSKIATINIANHLKEYEQILSGAKGLFAASQKVELDEWKKFINIQDIETKFPGIQGVGYIHHITEEERDNFVKELRNNEIKDYVIKPDGIRDEYYPVTFLEPDDFRNKRAIGYDIYSEETRRQAVNTLKNTGITTITGKIVLVQETEEDVQNGFLMLEPIFSNDPNESNELEGIAYAVFRMNDFINAVMDSRQLEKIHLKIYDEMESEENLLFDSEHITENIIDKMEFSQKESILIGNRHWIFSYYGVEPQFEGISLQLLVTIPIIGISISVLLFYFARIFVQNLKLTKEAVKNEKIAAMGVLASRIAHDVRNPLSIISVCLENLKLLYGVDSLKQKQMDKISRSVDTINNIIQDVLNFVKTEHIQLETTSTDIILRKVINQIDVPNRIKIHLPKKDIVINCDKNKMESVISNLIVNSIQAIKNDGEITISVNEDSKNIRIIIEDSGPGIPENKISEIFEAMYTTKKLGTGLGLSICKNIIEAHGGNILVSNHPTKFIIQIPKSQI